MKAVRFHLLIRSSMLVRLPLKAHLPYEDFPIVHMKKDHRTIYLNIIKDEYEQRSNMEINIKLMT